MKRENEILKHLDRAFVQTPPELTASVEEAFRRGEKAVKQRQKIMAAVSVAAVLAVLCAALALAASQLVKPRMDSVVAARGSGNGGASLMNRVSPEPTVNLEAGEVETSAPEQQNAIEPETEAEALLTERNIEIMTAQRARDIVVDLDAKAEKAREFWIYLSSEANGAWVFYATGYDSKKALFQGGAWYVDDHQGMCLGHSDAVSGWVFFTRQTEQLEEEHEKGEIYARNGIHIDYGQELFASAIRNGDDTRVHLWRLGEGGEPEAVETGEKLISLSCIGGILVGITDRDSVDYCFLREHAGQLHQVTAQPTDVQSVAALPGGKELLKALEEDYSVTGCLYRSMGGDTEAEVITLNLEQGGEVCHTYLYRDSAEEELQCSRGWEKEIAVYGGEGALNPDAGLPAVASGNIEETYRARAMSVPAQTATPVAMSIEADSAAEDVFYATVSGRYFHRSEHCGGMHAAYPLSLDAAWVCGKYPCPVCVGDFKLPQVMFYATEKGQYYHVRKDCSGMKNAKLYSFDRVQADGKQPCPACRASAALCWATPGGKYYHSDRECMGMWNARIYTELFCQRYGKTPCPECWEGDSGILESLKSRIE